MAQHVIGLDVGSWSIKAAVLESGLRKYSLEAFTEYVLPVDSAGLAAELLSESVRNALADVRERSQVIITAAPGSRVMTRTLEVPFGDEKRIRSILPFEMDGQLPTPVDELVFDYVHAGESEQGLHKIMVSAVSQRWLFEFLADLNAAGADPKSVGLDTMAYAVLVPRLSETGSLGVEESLADTDVAFIDLGHQNSSLCIVHEGRPVTVRTLSRGGRDVTKALAEAFDLDYLQAEHLKHSGVRLDGHDPVGVDSALHKRRVSVVGEALGPIVRDLRMSLHAHVTHTGRRIGKAFVFGGGARMPGLVEMLGQALGVSVQVPRVSRMEWAHVDADDSVDKSAPKAAALALRNAADSEESGQVNFRQNQFAYESDFKAFRDRAWWLVTLGVLLIGVLLGRQFMARSQLEEQKTALVAELKRFSKQTLGKEMTNFSTVLAKVATADTEDIDGLFPKMTAFKAFYLITEAQDQTNAMPSADSGVNPPGPGTPKPPRFGSKGDDDGDDDDDDASTDTEARYRIEFQSVTIDSDKASIRGEASHNVEALAEFEGRLQKIECFKEVKRTDAKPSRNRERATWKEFSLQIKFECEPPEEKSKGKKKKGKTKTSGGS